MAAAPGELVTAAVLGVLYFFVVRFVFRIFNGVAGGVASSVVDLFDLIENKWIPPWRRGARFAPQRGIGAVIGSVSILFALLGLVSMVVGGIPSASQMIKYDHVPTWFALVPLAIVFGLCAALVAIAEWTYGRSARLAFWVFAIEGFVFTPLSLFATDRDPLVLSCGVAAISAAAFAFYRDRRAKQIAP